MDNIIDIEREVRAAFETALDKLEEFERELSRWEEDCLVRALAAMTCGSYVDAAVLIRGLMAHSGPNIDSSREVTRPVRDLPLTITWLRRGLANIRAMT
jgi:hypothetical protein